jgi:hypothetical protein
MLSLTHNIRRTTIYTGQDTQSCKLILCVSENICIKFAWLCVLSCIYCRTSYIVCQWEYLYEVCMFEYLVLNILSYVYTNFIQMLSLTHNIRRTTIYTGQDTQSCKLYTDVLTDTQYNTYASYIVCQWEYLYEVCMFEYLVLNILSYVLYCVSVRTSIYRTRHTIMQTLYRCSHWHTI